MLQTNCDISIHYLPPGGEFKKWHQKQYWFDLTRTLLVLDTVSVDTQLVESKFMIKSEYINECKAKLSHLLIRQYINPL